MMVFVLAEPELAVLIPFLDDFVQRNDQHQAAHAHLELTLNALLDGFEWQRLRGSNGEPGRGSV